eukprot:gene24710-31084_t
MPTVGLGTAGLGSGTEDVVNRALDYGVRMVDTAQAAEWYKAELKITWQTAWKNLEALKSKHNIKHIGVSNFHAPLLNELLSLANTKVAVVQNWMDPFHHDTETRELAAQHQIQYMAYSSFGTQWGGGRFEHNPVLNTDPAHSENEALRSVADKHGVSIASVIISWAIQLGGETRGVTIIPRSASPRHIEDNFSFLTASGARRGRHAGD